MQELTRRWTQIQPAVSAFISSVVQNYHDAEDVLQCVATAVVNKYDQYDPARPFSAWVFGVAKYEILADRRSHARNRILFDTDTITHIADAFEEARDELPHHREALQHCIQKLKDRARESLQLRYVEGKSSAEIAETMGMTTNAAFVMFHRIRVGLRGCITKFLGRERARP